MIASLIRPALAGMLLLSASLATAEITFHSDMESGNGTDFTFVDDSTVEWRIESDTNSSSRQWYMFDVRGAGGRTLTFRLLNADETNVRSHWRGAWPVYSTDGGHSWSHVTGPTEYEDDIYTFTHTLGSHEERIAFHFPYTWTRARGKIAEWERHPDVHRETIGRSVEGRPIEYLRVTDDAVPDEGKRGFWVIARQHSAEVTSSFSMEGFTDFLLSDEPGAITLRQNAILHLVPMVNPDGVIHGNYRMNAMGVNLNRVWDSNTDPATAPEVPPILDLIEQWVEDGNDFSMFIDFHSTASLQPHFAFHADYGVEPPLYHTPENYHADLNRYLRLVNQHAPMFDYDRGQTTGDNNQLAYHSMRNQYGVLAMTPEGTFSRQYAGPNADDFMTEEVHTQIGVAFAKALVEFFQLGVPEGESADEALLLSK